MFEHANTRKHVYEPSFASMRVFLSILAHLAHLGQSSFFDFKCDKWVNILLYADTADTKEHIKRADTKEKEREKERKREREKERADTKEHINEYTCSSVRVILSILTHLAHLAQSIFNRIDL